MPTLGCHGLFFPCLSSDCGGELVGIIGRVGAGFLSFGFLRFDRRQQRWWIGSSVLGVRAVGAVGGWVSELAGGAGFLALDGSSAVVPVRGSEWLA
jgi:hypothetical protein